MCGHGICQWRGHNRHDRYRLFGHGAFFNSAGADIVQKQNTHFIAGDQLVASVRAAHGNADAVGIRVSGQHEISVHILCQFQPVFQSLEDLRVRIRAGGEIAIGIFLLGDNGDVGNAHIVQNFCHRDKTGAVERRVYQLEAGRFGKAGANLAGFNGFIKSLFAVIADKPDESLLYAFRKGHTFGSGQHIGLLDFAVNNGGCVVCHLAAIGTVSFITVIFCRVVRGSYHDAGIALIISCSKGESGNGHQRIIDSDMNAVSSQHAGSFLGKNITLQAAVIGDGNGLAASLGQHPVGKTLRCLAHDPDVHTVCPGTECAAKAGCTEFQGYGKAVVDLIFTVFNS